MDLLRTSSLMILLLLGAAACATAPPKVWSRVDGTHVSQAEFQGVRAQCVANADQISRSIPAPAVNNTIIVQNNPPPPGGVNFIDRDYVSEGYHQGDAGRAQQDAFNAQFDGCMAQRGYILVDTEPTGQGQ